MNVKYTGELWLNQYEWLKVVCKVKDTHWSNGSAYLTMLIHNKHTKTRSQFDSTLCRVYTHHSGVFTDIGSTVKVLCFVLFAYNHIALRLSRQLFRTFDRFSSHRKRLNSIFVISAIRSLCSELENSSCENKISWEHACPRTCACKLRIRTKNRPVDMAAAAAMLRTAVDEATEIFMSLLKSRADESLITTALPPVPFFCRWCTLARGSMYSSHSLCSILLKQRYRGPSG